MPRMPKPMVEAIVCGTCVHYHQHYVLEPRGRWVALWYGHCGARRIKSHRPDETCEHWKERLDPDE